MFTPQPQREIVTRGCRECALREPCGGRDIGVDDLFGCYDRCYNKCAREGCDLTCSNNQELFAERWAEVGGLLEFAHRDFSAIATGQLTPYIPMIRPGIIRKRRLNSNFVALSLYEALRALKVGNRYIPMGRSEFRKKLRLRDDCKILMVGVGPDALIESFWRHHRALVELLPPLDVVAVTAPNFSSFVDVPRDHILYNRKRSLIVADKLLARGVPVVPHFNANTSRDWEFWAQLLRDTPGLRIFCKEFQTGNRIKVNYEESVEKMARMQESVGDALYPIVVAGKKAVDLLKHHFSNFTLIDSMPSIKTNMRQVIRVAPNGIAHWRTLPSNRKACLASLLDYNLAAYKAVMLRVIGDRNDSLAAQHPEQIPGELLLSLV